MHSPFFRFHVHPPFSRHNVLFTPLVRPSPIPTNSLHAHPPPVLTQAPLPKAQTRIRPIHPGLCPSHPHSRLSNPIVHSCPSHSRSRLSRLASCLLHSPLPPPPPPSPKLLSLLSLSAFLCTLPIPGPSTGSPLPARKLGHHLRCSVYIPKTSCSVPYTDPRAP